MTEWNRVRHFTPEEFIHPERVDIRLVYTLDHMRHDADKERKASGRNGIFITINETLADRPDNPSSWHPRGCAADYVIWDAIIRLPLPILEQYEIARNYVWGAIGIYPFWNRPGLHSDTRPRTIWQPMKTWWRDKDGQYKPMWMYKEAT